MLHRKTIANANGIKQQEEQSKRGLEAEEFVLALERKRLPEKALRIKRISDYDVSAGFDIVSFESESSTTYDRFIEVKCYLGNPHFYWSDNECDVAKCKGEKYSICLVNYDKINTLGYIPDYIVNPAKTVFEDDGWLMSAASFFVQKVQE